MPKWFNVLFQVVGWAGQLFNVLGGAVPPRYQWIVAAVLGGIQASVGIIAHHYNTDGTPQTTAYKPPVT